MEVELAGCRLSRERNWHAQRRLKIQTTGALAASDIWAKSSTHPHMTHPKPEKTGDPTTSPAGSQEVHAALIQRLARIRPIPAHVRPPQSMQPTPEAAQTRAARLRRKQRLLLKKAKRPLGSQLSGIPPAPDPLAP